MFNRSDKKNKDDNQQDESNQNQIVDTKPLSINGYVSPYIAGSSTPATSNTNFQTTSQQQTPQIQQSISELNSEAFITSDNHKGTTQSQLQVESSQSQEQTAEIENTGSSQITPQEITINTEQIVSESTISSVQTKELEAQTETPASEMLAPGNLDELRVETPEPPVHVADFNLNQENPELQQSNIKETVEDEIPTVQSVSSQVSNQSVSPELTAPVEVVVQETAKASPADEAEIEAASLTSLTDDINIKKFLDTVIEKKGSDLHLTVGYPPMLRIDSRLEALGKALTPEEMQKLINQTLTINQKELLEVNKEVDLSYSHGNKARFRVNAYNERGSLAAAFRLIPNEIRSVNDLNLPSTLLDFTRLSQGLFLVTGPTGSGKSTTLASMLQEINLTYPKHILTIEDPIEYVYPKARALIDQRELGTDTHDWNIALRSALRQDPDVVLIGEMRDFETIQAAITIAETGHLVFATLHTNSAAQSIDRIIDVFPPHQQGQIRTQLAGTLKGILSQRLIPKIGGGREAAIELMIVTPAIQNLIREGKTYQIDNIISTSFDIGMVQLERSLVKMIREGKIGVETAQEYAIRPEEIIKLMKSGI